MVRKRKVLQFTNGKFLEEKDEEEVVKESEEKRREQFLSMISLATNLGFSISLPIAGGAFLGHILDSKFSTSPKITLSLLFLGLFIGLANIYFIMKKLGKE